MFLQFSEEDLSRTCLIKLNWNILLPVGYVRLFCTAPHSLCEREACRDVWGTLKSGGIYDEHG